MTLVTASVGTTNMDMLFLLFFGFIFGCLEASPYLGMTLTYYPKDTGSYTIEMRYKITATMCDVHHFHCFSGDCGKQIAERYEYVDRASTVLGHMCQFETVKTLESPTNAPYKMWIKDRADAWPGNLPIKVFTEVELRTRLDTGRVNFPPQATIMSPLRVASNCLTEIHPLTFDPDGDEVVCRYGRRPYECDPCNPPSFFTFTPSCTLSFKPLDNKGPGEGLYVVELMMEDYPRNNIVLTQNNGTQEKKNTSEHISLVPFQFTVQMSPALPSCIEGDFIPRFVKPTPEHGSWINVIFPSHSTIFSVQAEASKANISGLLFSGPSRIDKGPGPGEGSFNVMWNPAITDDKATYPLCFVAQVHVNSFEYHSEVRCVLLIVGDAYIASLPTTDTTNTSTAATPTSTTSTTTTTTTASTATSTSTATTASTATTTTTAAATTNTATTASTATTTTNATASTTTTTTPFSAKTSLPPLYETKPVNTTTTPYTSIPITDKPTNTPTSTTSTSTTSSMYPITTNTTLDISTTTPLSTTTPYFTKPITDTPTNATSTTTIATNTTTNSSIYPITTKTLDTSTTPFGNAPIDATSTTTTSPTSIYPITNGTTPDTSTTTPLNTILNTTIPITDTSIEATATLTTTTTSLTSSIYPITNETTSNTSRNTQPNTTTTNTSIKATLPPTTTTTNITAMLPLSTNVTPMNTTITTTTVTEPFENTTSPPNTSSLPVVLETTTSESGEKLTVFTRVRISSFGPLSEEEMMTTLSQLKEELVRRGVPANFILGVAKTSSKSDTAGTSTSP